MVNTVCETTHLNVLLKDLNSTTFRRGKNLELSKGIREGYYSNVTFNLINAKDE
jgi:hypothetical protein